MTKRRKPTNSPARIVLAALWAFAAFAVLCAVVKFVLRYVSKALESAIDGLELLVQSADADDKNADGN